jgi:hypothetical protein
LRWIIQGRRIAPVILPSLPAVRLGCGTHRFEVRFLATHDNQAFELFWRPPYGGEEILPPSALAVPSGGVWPVT